MIEAGQPVAGASWSMARLIMRTGRRCEPKHGVRYMGVCLLLFSEIFLAFILERRGGHLNWLLGNEAFSKGERWVDEGDASCSAPTIHRLR